MHAHHRLGRTGYTRQRSIRKQFLFKAVRVAHAIEFELWKKKFTANFFLHAFCLELSQFLSAYYISFAYFSPCFLFSTFAPAEILFVVHKWWKKPPINNYTMTTALDLPLNRANGTAEQNRNPATNSMRHTQKKKKPVKHRRCVSYMVIMWPGGSVCVCGPNVYVQLELDWLKWSRDELTAEWKTIRTSK